MGLMLVVQMEHQSVAWMVEMMGERMVEDLVVVMVESMVVQLGERRVDLKVEL